MFSTDIFGSTRNWSLHIMLPVGKHGFGSIRKSHGAWYLRYYTDEVGTNGEKIRRQIAKMLAPVSNQYRYASDVQSLADDVRLTLRRSASAAESSLTLSEFADRYYLPWTKTKRKASTHKFYKDAFDNHLRERVGGIRLRDFRTNDAQRVLDAIELSQQSLLRIKTAMSAIFSYAIRIGFLDGINPVRESKAEGKRSQSKRYAYGLKEILYMLNKLTGRAKVAVGIAAFAGLRESEIRGLQWPDYDGELLHVQRAVWRTHVDETKTEESKNAVPVIRPLKKILDEYRKSNGIGNWILAGDKKGFALNLDNLSRREIRPVVGADRWHGWHSFRRGLMTNLFELGVPPEVAQTILRHADASTSRKHYLMLQSVKQGRAAMRKLERALAHKGAKRSKRKGKNR
jgi:integrase